MIAKRCHDVNTDRELVVNPRHIVIIHVTVYGKEKICSLTTLRGSLSSRSPTNFECRHLSASVHSRNSICATASGLNQTAFFIFSALSSSPNRDRLVSGKFTNGHAGVTRCFN